MANITLVIGGARSGKSSYASRLALSACDAPVYAGRPAPHTALPRCSTGSWCRTPLAAPLPPPVLPRRGVRSPSPILSLQWRLPLQNRPRPNAGLALTNPPPPPCAAGELSANRIIVHVFNREQFCLK
jgi:hypothetical protein